MITIVVPQWLVWLVLGCAFGWYLLDIIEHVVNLRARFYERKLAELDREERNG